MGNAPVRTHHPLIAIFITQQVSDDVLAVTVAHIAAGRVLRVRNGVVRHYGAGAAGSAFQSESPFHKTAQVHFKVSSGVHRVFPVIEMGVTAAFFRTAGGPVLHHGIHTLWAPAAVRRTLEAVYISARHVCV